MNRIKAMLKRARLDYRNSRGKKLKGRYLVIESDDWGSIRQSSPAAWKEQIARSAKTEADPFFHYDALERGEDLERIWEVLSKYTDRDGNHPVMTADYAVANPDFARIEAGGLESYFWEPFPETAKRYPDSENLLELCRQGMEAGVWKPQLNCREHVQVPGWMKALRQRDPEISWAFAHQMISTAESVTSRQHFGYMDAFCYPPSVARALDRLVEEAAGLFQALFGFRSETFVASCYVWNSALEQSLRKNGIRAMQGGWYQWIPGPEGSFVKKTPYGGARSAHQLYLVRNCLLEHSLFGDRDCVGRCLGEIESAFRWKQPAVLSSHRVNYIGRLVPGNGAAGARILDELQGEVLKRWPDVRFLSSDQLAALYRMEDER